MSSDTKVLATGILDTKGIDSFCDCKEMPNAGMLLLRARFNSHRSAMVFTVVFPSRLEYDLFREVWLKDPVEAAIKLRDLDDVGYAEGPIRANHVTELAIAWRSCNRALGVTEVLTES